MKQDVAKKWIKALRSGKYKQTKGVLRDEINGKPAYCCLGVLCETLGMKARKHAGIPRFYYGRKVYGVLPLSAFRLTGMKSFNGYLRTEGITLTDLNDEGKSFKQIAKVIEKHWKEL